MTTVSTIVTADSKKDGGIGHVRLEWPVTIRWNERSRSFGIGGHVGVEYATPEQADPGQLLALNRGHWSIENRLHWVRDVTFDEDRCQVRKGHGPQVLACLRNAVIGLLRRLIRQPRQSIASMIRHFAAHPAQALAVFLR